MARSPPLQVAASAGVGASPRDFDAIFAQEFSYVWRTLGRLGIREPDREDLANEVFFQIYRRLPTFDFERPLRPWLFAFAFRIASGHRRLARNRLEQSLELSEVVDGAPRADESMERRESQELVDRGLESLELGQRAVFVLFEIDGCAMPEIATALAIPLNTAYSRLRLARARFAAAVRRIKFQQGES
jgi:RNA polymerase sigma-70 factor (ECF subfamily)